MDGRRMPEGEPGTLSTPARWRVRGFHSDLPHRYRRRVSRSRTIALTVLADGEVPLYTGDIESDIRTMNHRRAEEVGGKLSFPGKMDCPSWGIPARRCRIGSILAQREGTTCNDCYALKGTFRLKSTDALLEDNYRKLQNFLWTPALAAQIRWEADDRFRWFMSGDVQGRNHLLNIIQICLATRRILHWLPTREDRIVRECAHLIPDNLMIRQSATMIDARGRAVHSSIWFTQGNSGLFCR